MKRVLLTVGVAFVLVYAGAVVVLTVLHPRTHLEAPEKDRPLHLPADFMWGTATAAHQVEGGITANDWTDWEAVPGHIKAGQRVGQAADHYNRVAEDVALMKGLHANAYRFSLEWSRLEPEEGQWNQQAWAHYADEVAQLRAAGITPMVTLLHFTLPGWLAQQGGLLAPAFAARFARLAAEAARRLGDGVDLWCTINEPNVQMFFGYVDGIWPPGSTSLEKAVLAMRALVVAHAQAAHALRTHDPASQVGAAVHLVAFEPASRLNLFDWGATLASGNTFNWVFYDSIQAGRFVLNAPGFPSHDEPVEHLAGSADYLGVNYYTRRRIAFAPSSPTLVDVLPGPGAKTDLGWEIYPEGLLQVLRQAHKRYGLPIFITENGLADEAGNARGAFLRAHAYALSVAMDEGVAVRGYFYWSLLDNFEWAEGYAPRFGLYQIDHTTMARSPAGGWETFRALAPSAAPE